MPDENPTGTPVTADNLLARGYREWPCPSILKTERNFEKFFENGSGKKFQLIFMEWDLARFHRPCPRFTFDADLRFKTNTGGNVKIVIQEPTIEATEARAEALWRACGDVYYERNEDD